MNNGPSLTSPQQAAIQIRAELQGYIAERKDKPSGWQDQAEKSLKDFKTAFPLIDELNAKAFTFDELKSYVINNLASQFVVAIKSMLYLHGGSTLRTKLEDMANSWPTQKDYELALAKQQSEQAQNEASQFKAQKEEAEKARRILEEEKAAAEAANKKLEDEKQSVVAEHTAAQSQLAQLLERQQALERALEEQKAEIDRQVLGNRELEENSKQQVAELTERLNGLRLVNEKMVARLKQQSAPIAQGEDAANQVSAQQQSYRKGRKKH
ncbi:MAG: hypothetical protein AB7I18_01480 [Candidatus Berkiella sp.]